VHAKFTYWCFVQAALQMKVANPFPRIFGARELEKWGIKEKRTVVDPMRGDVLVKLHRHVGIVTGPTIQPKGIVPSVEGNTFKDVRKEGVYNLKREQLSNCTFIRL